MINFFSEIYQNCLLFYSKRAPDLEDYPLTGTPFLPLLIIFSYLYFVLKCGPEYMKNRKPYQLDTIMIFYNGLQMIANMFLTILGLYICIYYLKDFFCLPKNGYTLFGAYMYYILKYADLLETFMFVLRKKQSQVTTLHVYHHVMNIVAVYMTATMAPFGHGVLYVAINSFVHVVMYGYYFMSIYKPHLRNALLPIKKNVTRIQLVQFGILFIHFGTPLFFEESFKYCTFPRYILWFGLIQCIVFIGMFGNFYVQCYNKEKPKEER